MSDVQILPLRRLVLISLILGLTSLILLNQALASPDTSENNSVIPDAPGVYSPPTSSETSSTASNTTSDQTSSESAEDGTNGFVTQASETTQQQEDPTTQNSPYQYDDQELANDEDIMNASDKAGNFPVLLDWEGNGGIFSFLLFSTSLLGLTILFLILFAISYVFIINSGEIKEYINTALKLAGFNGVVGTIGKSWILPSSEKINMKMSGFKSPSITIELPELGNPEEFGFIQRKQKVITTTNLEMLPLKLQTIRLYLKSYENSVIDLK